MSNIPVIKSVVNSMIPDGIQEGVISDTNMVWWNGAQVSPIYMNGVTPQAGAKCLMVFINRTWYVIGIDRVDKRQPVIMWHGMSNVITGGALAQGVGATQAHCVWWSQGGIANGNSFFQNVFLPKGDYVFNVLGVRDTNRGRLDWYLNSALIVSAQDWYNASTSWNTLFSTNVNVPYTGYHEVKGVVNGKHASSTNFAQVLTYYAFLPI